jgi:hypothetical protein
LGQRKYEEAEPLLLANLEAMRDPKDGDDPEATPTGKEQDMTALERIVRLYEAWGKPEPARIWRKELAGRAELASPR